MSAAESTLNVSRSTISRQLSDLETRLNLKLCERGPAGFRLTNEGRSVLRRSEDLLISIEDFRRHVHELRDEIAGDLNVALSDATVPNSQFDLPGAIARFLEQAPAVRLSLRMISAQDMEIELFNRRSHVGLKAVHERKAGFHYQPLHDEINQLYIGHRHPMYGEEEAGQTVAAIKQQCFAALSYESGYSPVLRALGIASSATASDLEGLSTLILTGKFIGFLPQSYGEIFEQRGMMRPLDHPDWTYRIPFEAVSLDHDEKTIMVRLFLDCLSGAASMVRRN